MSTVACLTAALVAAVAFIVAKFLYRKDTEQEAKHKHYIELASILKSYGLKDIPAILIDLAVEDYSDAYAKVKFWVQLLQRDSDAVVKEFDEVLARVLAAKGLIAVKAPTEIVQSPSGPSGNLVG